MDRRQGAACRRSRSTSSHHDRNHSGNSHTELDKLDNCANNCIFPDNIKPTNINIYFLLLTIPVTVYNLQLYISRLGHLAELHQTDKHNHFLKLMTIP